MTVGLAMAVGLALAKGLAQDKGLAVGLSMASHLVIHLPLPVRFARSDGQDSFQWNSLHPNYHQIF